MLAIYLASLVLGGILVGASVLAGGHEADAGADHDLDHDLDHDADLAADHDLDHDLDHDADLAPAHEAFHLGHDSAEAAAAVHAGVAPRTGPWRPLLSLRFWTFFLAFFGLTGSVLQGLKLAPAPAAFVAALALGGASGLGVAYAIHRLRRTEIGTAVGARDFVGREALVMLRLRPGQPGKIRLELGGETIELLAAADETIERGAAVLVYDMEGSVARVSRSLDGLAGQRRPLPPAAES